MPAEGFGPTPPAVCVAVSHGKRCGPGELQPEGDVMVRMCFQRRGLTMHVDMLGNLWRKFSAPLGPFISMDAGRPRNPLQPWRRKTRNVTPRGQWSPLPGYRGSRKRAGPGSQVSRLAHSALPWRLPA
ncbi:hypothetical protein Q5P01_006768 [Channa striata]|uniref:Uncharacterized protein n=1 Tax=Channa striata TaxID=64152 RepID=A0AA88N8J5_CHASR|nr:hypothetical protein Q5P01_006768 [Channa striata]